MTAIHNANNQAVPVVVPDTGRVFSVFINVHTVISTGNGDVTFDILKNNADTGVDVTLPDATADESGVEMVVPSEIHVEPGDALILQSNGEQVAATTAEIGWCIRR